MQCLGGSPGHCTSQHRPAPALHMISFENLVKSMPPSLSELKVTPSFCYPFKIADNPTASSPYIHSYQGLDWVEMRQKQQKTKKKEWLGKIWQGLKIAHNENDDSQDEKPTVCIFFFLDDSAQKSSLNSLNVHQFRSRHITASKKKGIELDHNISIYIRTVCS